MKKFLISSLAVAAMAFAFSASAATVQDMGSATLKKGSSGAYVMALQNNLNACAGMSLVADGKFGKGTAAAAMTFQASTKGLKADGLVGGMTKTALAAACTGTTTTTGSTSTVISGGAGNISSIINLGSPSSTTVSEGDTNKAVLGFEVKADAGSDLKVANIGIKFAKSTGSGSTWVSRYINKVSIMQGSTVIGSVDASALSQNGNDYTANIAVNNSVIKANDRAQFYVAVNANSNIDSNDSSTYLRADVTSIRYMDATGAVLTNTPATSINQTFSVVKLSQNSNVKLQVSEDSANPRNRTVTTNYTTTTTDVSLLKFNVTATGTAMYVNELDVLASATGVNDVTQAARLFKLKHNGNVISTVNFTAGNTGSSARLVKFGETSTTNVASYTASSLNGGSSLIIPAGQTASFEVLADINPIATGSSATVFDAGDTLTVTLPSSYLFNGTVVDVAGAATVNAAGSNTCTNALHACWSVLDASGNTLSTATINRQGSATGYAATFRTQGLSSTMVSTSAATANRNTGGLITSQALSLNVSVNASGSDFFIPQGVAFASSASSTAAISSTSGFAIAGLNAAGSYETVASTSINDAGRMSGSAVIVSGATIDPSSGRFKIAAGQTAEFKITVTINNPSGNTLAAGQRKVQLNAVGGATDPAGAVTAYATLPAYSFQSTTSEAF